MFNEVVPIVKLTIVKTPINTNLRKDSIESALICVNRRFYGYLLIVVSGF